MGGNTDRAYEAAVEMTKAWEQAHNFDLFDDALPVLDHLREHGLKLGLVSNTGRDVDEFLAPQHQGGRRAVVAEGEARPTIFQAVLDRLGVPSGPRWSATRPRTTSRGARARHAGVPRRPGGRLPRRRDRLPDLFALPAAIGLAAI